MSVKDDNMSVETQMQESAAELKIRLLRQMAERIGIKITEETMQYETSEFITKMREIPDTD